MPLSPAQFRVSPAEFDRAEQGLSAEIKAAVLHAIANVRTFHQSQMPPEVTWHQVQPGVMAGEKITAVLTEAPGNGAAVGGLIAWGSTSRAAKAPFPR